MASETKVGLLVGLAFIVCFAVILANRGREEQISAQLPYSLLVPPPGVDPPADRDSAHPRAASHTTAAHRSPAFREAGDHASTSREVGDHASTTRDAGFENPEMNEGRFDDRAPIESRLVSTANFPGTPARSFGEGESARASLTTPAGHAANGYADDRVRQGDLLSDSDIVGQSIAGMRALSAAGLDSASRSDPADDDPAHPPPPGGYRDRPIVEPNPQRGTGDALSAPADRANGRLAVDLEPVDRAHRDSAGARLASQAGVETQRLQALVDRTVPLRTSPFSPNGGAPVRAAGKKYTVVSGDNLYRIARKHYGVSSHHLVRAIFEANRTVLSHEDEVRIGDELFLPEVDSPRASTSPVDASVAPPLRDKPDGSSAKPARRHREPRPFRWYQVERDDRYTTIAAAQLGDARRWKELYEFNRDIFPDADRIRAGVRIRIPTVEVADARGGRR